VIEDCEIAITARVFSERLVNLYRCRVGPRTFVGPFVEIQAGVTVGADCKIESHTFLCTGVQIGDRVFIGHGVQTVNDKFPSATKAREEAAQTIIEDDASIGTGAVLMPVRIGRRAIVGAGAVVTKDVPAGAVVVGNPARVLWQT